MYRISRTIMYKIISLIFPIFSTLRTNDLYAFAIIAIGEQYFPNVHAAFRILGVAGFVAAVERDGHSVRRNVHMAGAVDGLVRVRLG